MWIAVAVGLCACDDPPPPWAAPPRRTVVDESQPFLASSTTEGWLGDAGFDDEPDAGADAAEPPTVEGPQTRAGGMWANCYDGFTPTGGAVRDVTRLGLICGPVNGMRRLGRTVSGAVTPSEPAEHAIEAVAGGCYRLFASSVGVEDLELVVTSKDGAEIVRDQMVGAWAVLDPDRPFCTFDAADLVVRAISSAGDGSYALQVWQLPPSKSR